MVKYGTKVRGQEHGNDNIARGLPYMDDPSGRGHAAFPDLFGWQWLAVVGSCSGHHGFTIFVKANPWVVWVAVGIGIAKYGSDKQPAFPNMEVTTTANRGCLWLSVGSRVGKFGTPNCM